jgi:Rubrerythrin
MKRLLMILTTIALIAAPLAAAPSNVLDDLQAAYNGESNAHAKYLAYAQKADQENYPSVASLFRAAAKAEEVHANNHADVIKNMGSVPKADIVTPEARTTAENLQDAIKGETYERDVMYPNFLKDARAARGATAAVRTFQLARTAEAEHAKLYAQALRKLPTLTGVKSTYYVCTVCGYTTEKLDFAKCLSCFAPKDKYVSVS